MVLLAALLLGPGTVLAGYGDVLNMPESVTEIGKDIFSLHMLVLWICTIVGIGVFGVMIYSIINHRKSKGATPASFHESTTVEIIWTTIPFVILIAIAVPATKTLLAYEDTSNADVTIKATGWQWKWEYEYLDEGIQFFSKLDAESEKARARQSGIDPRSVPNYLLNVDNPIVVPVDKKIRILTTAADVLHAWWVPDLAVKRDAIPGFINESWFRAEEVGTYRGQCAELCGKDHGFMPIVVEVKSEADYKQWVAAKQAAASAAEAAEAAAAGKTFTMGELMATGEQVYNANCAACHQPTGMGIPGVFPSLVKTPFVTGDIAAHIDIIVNGKAGTAMQAFGAQLSKSDIAAVVTYERNAWGNDTGDVIQPSDIPSAK
jgi:cytochrome c oxidase subunit 2